MDSVTETYSPSRAGRVTWWPNMHHAAPGGQWCGEEEWTEEWVQNELLLPKFILTSIITWKKWDLLFRIVL